MSNDDDTDPYVRFFDTKFDKNREILIFMEESKIWQELAQDCYERSGVNAPNVCRQLQEICHERQLYYNAKFNPNLRPKQTPGLPSKYEPRATPIDPSLIQQPK